MNETHDPFREIFHELESFNFSDKTKFLENLLFYFTITARAIGSDEQATDADKLEALKWLNELLHRIWNMLFELQNGESIEFKTSLHENMKFYGEQSTLLWKNLVPTVLNTFRKFKENQQEKDDHG